MRSRSFPSSSTNPQSQSSEITTVRFLGVLQEIPCTHTQNVFVCTYYIYIDTYIDTHTHRYMMPIFTQTGICNMCYFVPCFLSLLNLQEYIWRAEICDVDEVELIILKNGLFFCVASKKSLPKPTSQFLLFSSRIFMVLHLDLWPFTANFYIWREIQNKVYF